MKKSAFTLIELIVVITILAILGTIAFISFKGYTGDAKNSKIITDVTNIDKGLALKYAVDGILPLPTEAKKVLNGSNVLVYEGLAGESVLSVAGVSKDAKNPETGTFYPYSVSKDTKSYTLLGLVYPESASILTEAKASTTSGMDLYVKGSDAGMVLDSNNNVISADIDVATDLPNTYKLVLSQDNIIENADENNIIALTNNKISEPGLIGYWDMESKIGSKFADLSGNASNGIPEGGVEGNVVDGVKGKALKFDGVDDFLDISGKEFFKGNEARTVSFWVKLQSDLKATRFMAFGTSAPYQSFNIVENAEIPGVMGYSTTGTGLNSDDISNNPDYYPIVGDKIQLNEWQLVTATFDGVDSIKLYLNGKLQNEGQRTYQTTGSTNYIGKSNHITAEWHVNGVMDEIKVYNYELSQPAIEDEYKKLKK